jgi:hypothetical protein
MPFKVGELCKDAPLTEVQRKSINYFTLGRKKGSRAKPVILKDNQRLRYWCPIEKIGYIASEQHYVCKLCNSGKARYPKLHEITPYDKKIHGEF